MKETNNIKEFYATEIADYQMKQLYNWQLESKH